ncbi:DUF1349 domain-containing protein [Streptacidiphilus sp. ASG 303]|uniref:DUF1349 domain-containing protein n=1 Tax=Streptacidiphilus sp. ASG 303 TaxID=2896847 RepID=UPI001E3DB7DC|nr:DUF1349 domain-containing protein [Streptacidiphilus sp. ASG 303]MCD0483908.1 DUF1349 domain-containing protein [Streptacidiphilus sp. ASG 303]
MIALAEEGPPGGSWSIDGGTLTMTAAPRSDLFADPAGREGEQLPDAARLVGVPPEGDFTFAARVEVGFRSTYDAGVLLLHAGERLWAKLCLEYSPQARPTAVTVVTRGTSDDANAHEAAGGRLWLRIARTGGAFAFHSSADGRWWRLLRYFTLGPEAAGRVRIGFMAQSPLGEGCTAVFDRISLLREAPKDLRDGS